MVGGPANCTVFFELWLLLWGASVKKGGYMIEELDEAKRMGLVSCDLVAGWL
jgi:hypothetical protein